MTILLDEAPQAGHQVHQFRILEQQTPRFTFDAAAETLVAENLRNGSLFLPCITRFLLFIGRWTYRPPIYLQQVRVPAFSKSTDFTGITSPMEVAFMGSMPITMEEAVDLLLTAEEVAFKLKVSKDWVWDHSSRRLPYLPVIRMSDGALRYRASGIEEFLKERERASHLRRKRR